MTTAGDLQTKIAHRVLERQNLLGRHLLIERTNSKWRGSKHQEKGDKPEDKMTSGMTSTRDIPAGAEEDETMTILRMETDEETATLSAETAVGEEGEETAEMTEAEVGDTAGEIRDVAVEEADTETGMTADTGEVEETSGIWIEDAHAGMTETTNSDAARATLTADETMTDDHHAVATEGRADVAMTVVTIDEGATTDGADATSAEWTGRSLSGSTTSRRSWMRHVKKHSNP